ncbi:uncharacterized protein LOC111519524 [Drosophila willistoni]|uniref:uncharacterized protein LOC111519524 n=1 Tax=Drosophila willistoni TaxID=7260 RepID=UPI00017D947C|nr:uncharacterized protein LOC111519524 [Drosophila willistoni]
MKTITVSIEVTLKAAAADVENNNQSTETEVEPKKVSIDQLPNLASNWATFLKDITNDRKLRTERLSRQSEDVMEFMNRFPLREVS